MKLQRKTRLRPGTIPLRLLVAVLSLSGLTAIHAEHRAVRLGHPATRFAPPLTEPDQLRRLFANERLRPDVEAILQQAQWPGNAVDLRRAAATAQIQEVQLPPGTRLPFMSSRKDGRPIALMDVVWAGDEPIDAYVFTFASNGRRYRCVTPKACSNFLVEDLGPDQPRLELTRTAPAEVGACDPIPVRVTVLNACTLPLTAVKVVDVLPLGMVAPGEQATVNLDAGDLKPGAGMRFDYTILARTAGAYSHQVRAVAAEGASVQATASTVVRGPALTLECQAPAEIPLGRPVEVCLLVNNPGTGPENRATLSLPIPTGAAFVRATDGGEPSAGRVVWELNDLVPDSTRRLCAVFSAPQLGTLGFDPELRGACTRPIALRCETRVVGIPAVLLEVIDLEDPIEVGNPVTYEIRVTNQGSAPGTNIRLTCLLPELQEFISGTGATAVNAQARQVTLEPLAVLEPKATATWRVLVRAVAPGDARFKVELVSDQFAQPIDEHEATQQY